MPATQEDLQIRRQSALKTTSELGAEAIRSISGALNVYISRRRISTGT